MNTKKHEYRPDAVYVHLVVSDEFPLLSVERCIMFKTEKEFEHYLASFITHNVDEFLQEITPHIINELLENYYIDLNEYVEVKTTITLKNKK
jgi:hypothetical protein